MENLLLITQTYLISIVDLLMKIWNLLSLKPRWRCVTERMQPSYPRTLSEAHPNVLRSAACCVLCSWAFQNMVFAGIIGLRFAIITYPIRSTLQITEDDISVTNVQVCSCLLLFGTLFRSFCVDTFWWKWFHSATSRIILELVLFHIHIEECRCTWVHSPASDIRAHAWTHFSA